MPNCLEQLRQSELLKRRKDFTLSTHTICFVVVVLVVVVSVVVVHLTSGCNAHRINN